MNLSKILKSKTFTLIVAVSFICAPLAFADPSEQGAVASNGNAVNNPGFDASGEARLKVITAIQGKIQPGVPNGEANKPAGLSTNGISYHKGPVMTDSRGLFLNIIWYGYWTDIQKNIIRNMVNNLGGSSYYNINSTYFDSANNKVPNKLTLVNEFNDSGSQGLVNLSDAAIWNAVVKAAGSPTGSTVNDANALTLVLTGTNVSKSGFLTSYCGWHTFNPSSTGIPVKYSFVGNPGTNPSCAPQTTSSPNGDIGVDALVSVAVHEIVETVTDPQLNAWYDSRGYENADKCAWTFGSTNTSSGYKWNVALGTTGKYYIQQNWVNANGGSCKLAY